MTPVNDEVQVAIATHGAQILQHTGDIAELKLLARDTLESMREFSERVTRLITLQEMAHTPENCPLRSRQDEIAVYTRNIEHELTQMRLAVEHVSTQFKSHEELTAARDQRLRDLEQRMNANDSAQVAENARKSVRSGIASFLLEGKWVNVAILVAFFYIIAQRMFPNLIP